MDRCKRFKSSLMIFEQLPNELFIELFTYLTNVDVVYSFSQLNLRFQNLIHNYCKKFDFKSVNKIKFDYVIQQHNPKYWQSLCLSNDDETPGQIDYFFRLFQFNQHISQLESLSLIDLKPSNDHLFRSQFQSINLISLTLKPVCGLYLPPIDIPFLKHLVITSCLNSDWIKNFCRLETLEYTIEEHLHHRDPDNLIWPRSLKQLKIIYNEKKHEIYIRKLISQLSNLICLKISFKNLSNSSPNGQIWEELIRSSLLFLEKFQFYFIFSLPADINAIITSFSTPFYLYDKSWYIRCDISLEKNLACLYSLPFVFENFVIHTDSFDTSITTRLTDENTTKNMYKNIKTLIFNSECTQPVLNLRPRHVDSVILNIPSLSIAWFPILTNLRHLSIGSTKIMASYQFAGLLENLPKLYYLTIDVLDLITLTNNWNNHAVCDLLSKKIRRLDLDPPKNSLSKLSCNVKFEDAQNLIRIFSHNCEHLRLYLQSYELIKTFIFPSMTKLCSLTVSGLFEKHGRTFMMNSIEQLVASQNPLNWISADWREFQIWFNK